MLEARPITTAIVHCLVFSLNWRMTAMAGLDGPFLDVVAPFT